MCQNAPSTPAYVPPHRRGSRGSSARGPLDRVDEDRPNRDSALPIASLASVRSGKLSRAPSTVLSHATSMVLPGSASEIGADDDHLATSTVVSAGEPGSPPLIFHPGVPPERIVELRHLRSSSPELDCEITPDDSVSVAFGGGGGRDYGGLPCIADADASASTTASTKSSLVSAGHRIPLEALSEAQVGSLLRAIGLGKYAAMCEQVPLRGRDLQHCSAEDLEAIGISFRPHRLSLLEEIAKLALVGVPLSMLAQRRDREARACGRATVNARALCAAWTRGWAKLNGAERGQLVSHVDSSGAGSARRRPAAPAAAPCQPAQGVARVRAALTPAREQPCAFGLRHDHQPADGPEPERLTRREDVRRCRATRAPRDPDADRNATADTASIVRHTRSHVGIDSEVWQRVRRRERRRVGGVGETRVSSMRGHLVY